MTRVRILSGPPAHAALLRGVDGMAGLLRPTLGPPPRTVAITRLTSVSEGPEILDNGAVIAHRTLQLADPFEDMGGMIVRHLVWRVHEQVGDGTGFSPVSIQSGIKCGLEPSVQP
jgi:chaperonin GroEL (HSP60 family)